ncbi:MAG: hypothetical protein RL095_2262 [Verrucomicrobiota bacterium]|jgi:Fe-S cluster biogenesis protein NfuA
MDLKYFTQPTPNPNAVKFILNRDVKTSGKISYTSPGQCYNNPLAEALFGIPEVTQIHFFENVITVTQNGEAAWEDMEHEVIDLVRGRIAAHDPDFKTGIDESERRANLPAVVQKIEKILDETIRPGLQGDGGDLLILEYVEEKKLLRVQYQGACTTCPSSSLGTLSAIKGILKEQFDPEINVVAE